MKNLLVVAFAWLFLPLVVRADDSGWMAAVRREVSRLGHRNMIIVADSAYPIQNGNGIRVIATGADHLAVVADVIRAIDASPGVRSVIALDKEFAFLPEERAKGATALRKSILGILPAGGIREELHERLLKEVNKTAAEYEVVVFKTTGTIPYSSVFITLDCGYWSAEAEKELRERMETAASEPSPASTPKAGKN